MPASGGPTLLDLPGLPAVPIRLPAGAPGWSENTDVVVVGSGIAGLTTALHLRRAGLHVTVVTKVNIDDGSTRWAQGGIAAVLDPFDSARAHAADTLAAGVGLCDPTAVEVLVTEGPARVRELIRMGAEFDRYPDGRLMLTREGGHRASRVIHAGGDATGAEIQRALQDAVRADPWVRLFDHALVVDLLTGPAGQVCGVTLHVLGEGSPAGVGAVLARAVVLATGGLGQVFASTTNPEVSTGDGIALALRAGAVVTDLEFVQFHPTALHLAGPADGRTQQPLVSEALRGEGARLVNGGGERFLLGQHELAELAPRDVVAKAIYREMRAAGTDHVWLDARHLGRDFLQERFPTIVSYCRAAGVEPSKELVPVAPAAHYASGGVRTDLSGRTTVPGLYACGEVACTGVHGANRLASNSLLEGLVFARRIAEDIAGCDLLRVAPAAPAGSGRTPPAAPRVELETARARLRHAMSRGAGVLRSAASLGYAAEAAGQVEVGDGGGTRAWELANLQTVATAILAAAYSRTETRGCHWRDDFPVTDDRWGGHLAGALAADGRLSLTWERR